jgi:phosphoserine phosphatase
MFIATLIADSLAAWAAIAAADRLAARDCAPDAWHGSTRARRPTFCSRSIPTRRAGGAGGAFPGTDVIVQPVATREQALLVADMDSTMITVECIDELADYAGIKAQIAEVTERAMRGELDFEGALDARVALLKGLDEAVIDRCLCRAGAAVMPAPSAGRTMRARGALTVLVSGGFTRFAEPVGEMLGFDRAIANRLEIEDGALTGTVTKPIVDADQGDDTLLAAIAERGLAAERALAVGDGANDLAMIRKAGLGVAYRAKPIVAAAAAARVDHTDLTSAALCAGHRAFAMGCRLTSSMLD